MPNWIYAMFFAVNLNEQHGTRVRLSQLAVKLRTHFSYLNSTATYQFNDNSSIKRIASCYRSRDHANSPKNNSTLAQKVDQISRTHSPDSSRGQISQTHSQNLPLPETLFCEHRKNL